MNRPDVDLIVLYAIRILMCLIAIGCIAYLALTPP